MTALTATHNIAPDAGITIDKRLLSYGLALMFFFLLAHAADQLDLPPKYDGLLQDEVFKESDDWRRGRGTDYDWRAYQERQLKKPKFGFDSNFEERKFRDDMGSYRDPRPDEPASLIRMQF